MKKLLYILFIIFIVGGCILGGNLKASAMVAVDGERWFSAADLIGDEIPEGAEDAKEVFDGMYLAVTSINREKDEISVVIHDKDVFLERIGIHEQGVLNELAIVWIKDRNNYPKYVDFLRSGEANDNISTIYYGNADLFGEGWLPSNTEVVLNVSGADLIHNDNEIIDFSILVNPLGASGGYNYSMCYRDLGYVSGMDCQMRISENMRIAYFPVARAEITEEVIEDEVISKEDIEVEAKNVSNEEIAQLTKQILSVTPEAKNDQNYENVTEKTKNVERNYEEKGNADSKMDVQVADSEDDFKMEVPIAGGKCTRQIIFPWWILVLIILGDIVVMWLFWPENDKNRKKVEKK